MPFALPFPAPTPLFEAQTGIGPAEAKARHAAVRDLHPYIREPLGMSLSRDHAVPLSWGLGLDLQGDRNDPGQLEALHAALLRFVRDHTVDPGLHITADGSNDAWVQHANGYWTACVSVTASAAHEHGVFVLGFRDADAAALFFKPFGVNYPPLQLVGTGSLRLMLEQLFAAAGERAASPAWRGM